MDLISGVLSVAFIFIGLYGLAKASKDFTNEKTFLLMFLCYILGSMVLFFMSDKLFFPNKQLLSKDAGIALFKLIEQLLLILFGYYFAKNESK